MISQILTRFIACNYCIQIQLGEVQHFMQHQFSDLSLDCFGLFQDLSKAQRPKLVVKLPKMYQPNFCQYHYYSEFQSVITLSKDVSKKLPSHEIEKDRKLMKTYHDYIIIKIAAVFRQCFYDHAIKTCGIIHKKQQICTNLKDFCSTSISFLRNA